MANTSPPLVRLNVNLNPETADALKAISDKRGQTFTETIRRAIALLAYMDAQTAEGKHFYQGDSDGKIVQALVIL